MCGKCKPAMKHYVEEILTPVENPANPDYCEYVQVSFYVQREPSLKIHVASVAQKANDLRNGEWEWVEVTPDSHQLSVLVTNIIEEYVNVQS